MRFCTFILDFKTIDLKASLTCGVWVHASALHPLLVLSEIDPILGTYIMFNIQYTNLLLCSLDRYTPMVFQTCEIGHARTSSLLSSEDSCICHTETEGCKNASCISNTIIIMIHTMTKIWRSKVEGFEEICLFQQNSHHIFSFLTLCRASPLLLSFLILDRGSLFSLNLKLSKIPWIFIMKYFVVWYCFN